MLGLHNLKAAKNSTRKRKRLGRGDSAGGGSTSGKGGKGQTARKGTSGFERRGLKSYLQQIPKLKGFKSFKGKRQVVNVSRLESFTAGSEVRPEHLYAAGLIPSVDQEVKVLGQGKLSKSLTVYAHDFSGTAKKAIEAAGGKTEIIKNKRDTKRGKKKA